MILLDTTVLSLAFRRRRVAAEEPGPVRVLRDMVREDTPLAVPGIVMQELLSGIRADEQFHRLHDLLQGFPLVLAEAEDHLTASRISNACRRHGVSAAAVDCLIAAMAVVRRGRLFTLDEDFSSMARHCDLQLFRV
jgi:predicted nucleic acid-binding protein